MTTENPTQPQTQPEPQAPALCSGDLFGNIARIAAEATHPELGPELNAARIRRALETCTPLHLIFSDTERLDWLQMHSYVKDNEAGHHVRAIAEREISGMWTLDIRYAIDRSRFSSPKVLFGLTAFCGRATCRHSGAEACVWQRCKFLARTGR